MADAPGVAYLRTTRGAYPVLYPAGTPFKIGGAAVLRSSEHDDVTLIGAGVTLHECLAAADTLAESGIAARVIDCYSIKPLDVDVIVGAVSATHGNVVVVEDHYPAGGLGEAVGVVLLEHQVRANLVHLAVRELSCSGTPNELLDAAKISAPHVVAGARSLVNT
jgi:transketolase